MNKTLGTMWAAARGIVVAFIVLGGIMMVYILVKSGVM